jgi:wyosine [tRNA(Phe)-imidazoG37] synthetase (radical SAM superfamily)
MKCVYGPVPSRRLGQSLGIDPIPLKTCNWNCVYCQLGRTVPLNNERREYLPRNDILEQVERTLARHKPGEIDWVTFVGSGEPTLHISLGWLIRKVKVATDLPVAVITNGSLLYLPEVRQELSASSAVMPSLDAGSDGLYRIINRPHPEVTFERLVDGLATFSREYSGKLWLEVMLVQGLNDTEVALKDIATIVDRIGPDEVHINLPNRPPVETWVRPSDDEGLMRAVALLGNIAQVVHPFEGSFDLGGDDTLIDAIVGIITRHPMRQEELVRTLAQWAPGQVNSALEELRTSGQAQIVKRLGAQFWSAAPSHYPDEAQSLATVPGVHRRRIRE